jgi:hypothetical protein
VISNLKLSSTITTIQHLEQKESLSTGNEYNTSKPRKTKTVVEKING